MFIFLKFQGYLLSKRPIRLIDSIDFYPFLTHYSIIDIHLGQKEKENNKYFSSCPKTLNNVITACITWVEIYAINSLRYTLKPRLRDIRVSMLFQKEFGLIMYQPAEAPWIESFIDVYVLLFINDDWAKTSSALQKNWMKFFSEAAFKFSCTCIFTRFFFRFLSKYFIECFIDLSWKRAMNIRILHQKTFYFIVYSNR